MDFINKHFFKFFVGLVLLMCVGLAVAYGTHFYTRQKAAAQLSEQEQALKEYEARYVADTYGGKTPEETLTLFVDALKKNDIDLAVKYVFIDDAVKIKTDLERAKSDGRLSEIIKNFGLLKISSNDNDRAFFSLNNSSSKVQYQVIVKRIPNNTWKIMDL